MKNPLETLETERLILKPLSLQDLDLMCSLSSNAEIMRYISGRAETIDETRAKLEKHVAHHKKHGFGFCAIYEKSTGEFVGRAGLIYLEFNDQQPDIEIGYTLHKKFWGRGYASEAVKALINWGFKNLNVNRLVAVIDPENKASRLVAEKCGLHYEKRAYHWSSEVAFYAINKPNLDFSKIKITPSSLKEYPIVENMLPLYVHDMSQYMQNEKGWEIGENGLFECYSFKKYWENEFNYPFLIRYENELVGFAIVDKKGSVPEVDFNMAQFFILNKFKHQGIGKYVAHQIFKQFKGSWEIMVIPGNEGAYRFWRNTIANFDEGKFSEYTKKIAHFNKNLKNIFSFSSP